MARFNDDEIGGRETGAWRLVPSQRTRIEDALKYEKIATKFLGDFKQQLQNSGLSSGKSNIMTLNDGTRIFVLASMLGLAHADTVHIDVPYSAPYPEDQIIIYGYVIYEQSDIYVKLPDGNQSGAGAFDDPTTEGIGGNYGNHPAFTFTGYPDFGGCKRVPQHAIYKNSLVGPGPLNYASVEFEALLVSDSTITDDYVTPPPPPPHTWPDIYEDWRDIADHTDVVGPEYNSDFAPSLATGIVSRRVDGHGLFINSPFTMSDGNIVLTAYYDVNRLETENTFHSDALIMLPAEFSISHEAEIISVQLNYWNWTNVLENQFQYDLDPNNPLGPLIVVHKWTITSTQEFNMQSSPLTVPVIVPHGEHKIYGRNLLVDYNTPGVYSGTVNILGDVDIYTSRGIIKRTLDKRLTGIVDGDVLGLTIVVGRLGREDQLIY